MQQTTSADNISRCIFVIAGKELTLKVPIITAADDKFCYIFLNFQLSATILMKYHALFVIFEKKKKRQNLNLLSAANYRWRFKGLTSNSEHYNFL